MTTKLTRTAEFRSVSYSEADNSIEVVWTTGASVRRRDWRTDRTYQEVLEVSPKAVRLDRLNAGASFLSSHDSSDLKAVIGSVVPGSARLDGGKGIARVRLSQAPSDADTVSKIKDGIIRNISVGYVCHKIEVTANKSGEDVWRVVDWEPMEISAVAIPADSGSQIRKSSNDHSDDTEFVPAALSLGTLDEEVAEAVRTGATLGTLHGESDTAATVANYAFDYQYIRSSSHDLAGIAFGVALVLAAGGAEGVARGLAERTTRTELDEEHQHTSAWAPTPIPMHRPR